MPGEPNPPVRDDDADIDALLGDTIARVGESPAVLEQTAKLKAMLDAAAVEPAPLVDPKSLAVRFSRLKLMNESPAHYFHACQQDDADFEETLAMRLGSGVHKMLLGKPGDVVLFDGHRNGRVWERFARAHEGATILNAREWKEAAAVVRAIRRNKDAERLILEDTIREEKIEWKHGSRECRSTPDARSKRWIAELKTTRSANPRWFHRDSFNRLYHAQVAFYDEAVEVATGRRVDELYIIAVETSGHHPVQVYRIPDELRELGTKTWRLMFERLLVCEAANFWPEYAQGPVDLEAPFAIGAEDDDTE